MSNFLKSRTIGTLAKYLNNKFILPLTVVPLATGCALPVAQGTEVSNSPPAQVASLLEETVSPLSYSNFDIHKEVQPVSVLNDSSKVWVNYRLSLNDSSQEGDRDFNFDTNANFLEDKPFLLTPSLENRTVQGLEYRIIPELDRIEYSNELNIKGSDQREEALSIILSNPEFKKYLQGENMHGIEIDSKDIQITARELPEIPYDMVSDFVNQYASSRNLSKGNLEDITSIRSLVLATNTGFYDTFSTFSDFPLNDRGVSGGAYDSDTDLFMLSSLHSDDKTKNLKAIVWSVSFPDSKYLNKD